MQPISATQLPLTYPGAFFPARLDWLCQPEQIEHTLRLLYYLNFWKTAQQHLLYEDRQGLWEAQALILRHATELGAIQPTTYLDGTYRFPGELLLESTAENAASGVLIHLNALHNPEIWPPFYLDGDTAYKRFIRPLYRRITGQDFKLTADAQGVLEKEQLRAYIQNRLLKMVEQAKTTHRPISPRRLAALCIAPVDLLPVRDNRVCFMDCYDSWEELSISDERKLDPEGYSEIAFQYTSASADFVLHLPFRWAEMFLTERCLRELQQKPGQSQERGIYQGQSISVEESQQHSAREILQDLGADLRHLCPHDLEDKETCLAQPAVRDLLWPVRYDKNEDWDDDPWFRGVENTSPQ
ncbi:MAG TPA: hypothetical protein VF458_10615 [Ktedonobacteraceae bacterium]